MLHQEILTLLHCTQCYPQNLLVEPSTTRAGETLCASHIRQHPEVYGNIRVVPGIPIIPPTSNVVYIPAPPVPLPESLPKPGKVDVTINKVLQLTRRWMEKYEQVSETGVHRHGTDSHPTSVNEDSDFPVHMTPQPSSKTDTNALVQYESELATELTCQVCYMLLYEPVTTPCQHTFCAECLLRSLDHNKSCPICRQELPGFAYFQDHPLNAMILSILLKAFPDQYQERKANFNAEEDRARIQIPIFVCQLAFPGIPTLLHLFEPRLMLRRCLADPNPEIGMIMPPGQTTEFGTMLEIKSVRMLPDGRSIVETQGSYRFRILERGIQDGYMVAQIERVDDLPASIEELASFPGSGLSSAEMMRTCIAFLERLQQGPAPWIVQRLTDMCGPQPDDPAQFSFWIAMVLPIAEHEKIKLLAIRSANMRLQLVVHWIGSLEANRYFASCVVM